MNWDIYKAKNWMLAQGMNHIRAGLFTEGGEMIFESKWGDGCNTMDSFKITVKRICWWDDNAIAEAVKEVMK